MKFDPFQDTFQRLAYMLKWHLSVTKEFCRYTNKAQSRKAVQCLSGGVSEWKEMWEMSTGLSNCAQFVCMCARAWFPGV